MIQGSSSKHLKWYKCINSTRLVEIHRIKKKHNTFLSTCTLYTGVVTQTGTYEYTEFKFTVRDTASSDINYCVHNIEVDSPLFL